MFSRTLRPLRAVITPRITLASPCASPPTRTLATESAAASTSQPSQSAPLQPLHSSAPKPPQNLPYFVGRNRMNHLSVYQRRQRGGSLKTTLLKKGEGNLQALREDVAEALGLTHKEVKVNSVTKHIEVKGHRRDDVLGFLRNMGF